MTYNIRPIQDELAKHVDALNNAQDIDALRSASVDFANKMSAQVKMIQGTLNEYEKRLNELQTFALQVNRRLEK